MQSVQMVWIHFQGNLGMSYRKGITFVQCLIDFLHQGPASSSFQLVGTERRPVRSLDSGPVVGSLAV